jgi:hypothetical protein
MKYNMLVAGVTLFSVFSTSLCVGAPYSASLENDFTLASNTNSDTWSYRLSDWATVPHPTFSQLLTDNTASSNTRWDATFATAPTLRSDASGYWGIGRNDTGSPQTTLGSLGTVTWPAGQVWAYPSNDGYPLRLVISWLAPGNGTIDANWEFTRPAGYGQNGVAIQVDSLIGGTFTAGVNGTAFSGSSPRTDGGPVSGSITGLSVSAGDRIYWTLENWGNRFEDPTRSVITITGDLVPIPEPSSLLLLSFAGAFLVALKRRKKILR